MEARISSIDGSCAFAACVISASSTGAPPISRTRLGRKEK
jgi:hypothetical protein